MRYVSCPHCQKRHPVPDALEVHNLQCSGCGRSFPVEPSAGEGPPDSVAFERDSEAATQQLSGGEPPPAGLRLDEVEEIWGDTITFDASPGMSLKSGQDEPPLEVSSATIFPRRVNREGTSVSVDAEFELIDLIGQGGMGAVFSARQVSMDRRIALKMILPDRARCEATQAKFVSEALVTAELGHPNIVPAYELGRGDDGTLFYAMKEVKGTCWKDVLGEKTEAQNLQILLDVSDAIAFAHDQGYVHRDLKPENIMLGDYGEVLVMDWGLAVSTGNSGKAEKVSDSMSRAGTPAYMAPEMASFVGGQIGPWSDIYLLGGILYEIATGLRPHAGGTALESVYHAAQNKIQPTQETGELIDVARKAMATDPTDRYPDVKAFQEAIRLYQGHQESILLCTKAVHDLEEAQTTGEYDRFAQALFAYREALSLWSENRQARDGADRAALVYARAALEKGDLDLSLSLLKPDTPSHRGLIADVREAIRTRTARKKRLRTMTLLAVAAGLLIVAGSIVATLQIHRERRRALEERNRALMAEAAARQERDKALSAKAAEKKQRRRAETQWRRAEFEIYRYGIAECDRLSRAGTYGLARLSLLRLSEEFRGWEFGHLYARVLCRPMPELPVLKGHQRRITAIAYAADGKHLVSGSMAGAVRIWDTKTGNARYLFRDHDGVVNSVCFFPDGKRIASAGRDTTIRIRDWTAGRLLHTLQAGRFDSPSLTVSPDNKRLVSCGYGDIAIWNTETGQLIKRFRAHDGMVSSVRFAPDGTRLASGGSKDRTVKLWDSQSGRLLQVLKGHAAPVVAVRFSADGQRLASVGQRGTIKVWSTAESEELLSIKEGSDRLFSVSFSPDGHQLAACGGAINNGTITLWDLAKGERTQTLTGFDRWVSTVRFSPDGKQLASGGSGNGIRRWEMTKGSEVRSLMKPSEQVRATRLTPDGKAIVFKTNNGVVKLVYAESGRVLQDSRTRPPAVLAFDVSPRDGQVVVGDATGKIRTLDLANGNASLSWGGHSGPVRSVCFSPAGDRLVSVGTDGQIILWDPMQGKEVSVLRANEKRVLTCGFSKDGKQLAIGGGDRFIRLLDSVTGRVRRDLSGHTSPVSCVSFSPDNQRLACGSQDKTIRLWHRESGRLLHTLDKHAGTILSLDFSPDGRRLVSGASDNLIKVWDVETGKEMLSLAAHESWVTSVQFTPDGKALVSGSNDGTIRLWETRWPEAGPVGAVGEREERPPTERPQGVSDLF